MALVLAAIILVVTLAWCAFVSFANSMSTTGYSKASAMPELVMGVSAAVLIGSLHWLPL